MAIAKRTSYRMPIGERNCRRVPPKIHRDLRLNLMQQVPASVQRVSTSAQQAILS
jgi:hypothetical protein